MNGITHGVVTCTVVFAMNKDIYVLLVKISLYHPPSPCTEIKSVKKS